jgi:hypothetical protein
MKSFKEFNEQGQYPLDMGAGSLDLETYDPSEETQIDEFVGPLVKQVIPKVAPALKSTAKTTTKVAKNTAKVGAGVAIGSLGQAALSASDNSRTDAENRPRKPEARFVTLKIANEEVKLNKPFRTPDGPKKFSVYVKNDKGNEVKVNFGDPNMEIKRDDPERLKSFRARHNCDDPGPKTKARYWSCYQWRKNSKVED